MTRSSVPVSEARQHLAELITIVRTEGRPVYLTNRGRAVAAVVSAEELDRLLDLAEDMEDIQAAEEAREEMRRTGQSPIPWDDVKADLGLT